MGGTMGYGLPLKCPSCPPDRAYGMLKVPGSRMMKCSVHGASLEVTNRTRCSVRKMTTSGRHRTGEVCGLELLPCKAECPNCGTRLVPSHPKGGMP